MTDETKEALEKALGAYGDRLVLLWIANAEAKYLKLKEKKPSKPNANKLLASFGEVEIDRLKKLLGK